MFWGSNTSVVSKFLWKLTIIKLLIKLCFLDKILCNFFYQRFNQHLKNTFIVRCFFCLCEFIVLLENFSIICRRHDYRWRAENFYLCSALMVIEQWGFFNVPHLLWYGPTLYNGHLRGPVTLTPVADRLAVELSLPVFTIQVCCDRGLNSYLPHARRTFYLYATAAFYSEMKYIRIITILKHTYGTLISKAFLSYMTHILIWNKSFKVHNASVLIYLRILSIDLSICLSFVVLISFEKKPESFLALNLKIQFLILWKVIWG